MTIKTNLHANNKHRNGYNFKSLIKTHPALSTFIIKNKHNQQDTIDFSDPNAVKALNVALLIEHYQIQHWDFPQGYLCPPIPGRVDYIHYLNDLLNETKIKAGENVMVLDIGTGASCIYPILGASEYGWNFVASDIDPISVKSASDNVKANQSIEKQIKCRFQHNSSNIFEGIIAQDEYYHLTLCNPPFHRSLEEAKSGNRRKWKNLSKDNKPIKSDSLNFGGQKAELWCKGGELAFIQQMVKESKRYKNQVGWFTCLVSKKDNLSKIKLYLKKVHVSKLKVINMSQGQKVSRIIAWRFS